LFAAQELQMGASDINQCKLSFLYSRIHRDRVLLIILYYNKTHERAGEIREQEEEEESRSCPETQIRSLVEKLTCTILQDTSYNARYKIVGIHRKLQHPGKKPTKEFAQSSWENSKARLHREMNRGELEKKKKKKMKTKEKVCRTTPL
jgi:hypothetical protein